MFNLVQMSRFAIVLGVLVLLLIAVSGMEASADDGQAISTVSTSSVASLQVARATPPVAQNKEADDVLGLSQDYVASWQNGNQFNSESFDLNTSFERIGGFYQTVDNNERNSAQVARIDSCYEASIGRYNSEVRGASTNAFSASAKFDAAMTHFTARRVSRLQFETCSKF